MQPGILETALAHHLASQPANNMPALTQGIFTFASLDNLCKVSGAALALRAQILNALPQSRLLLGNADDLPKLQRIRQAPTPARCFTKPKPIFHAPPGTDIPASVLAMVQQPY